MRSFGFATLLLVMLAGCQNSQTPNPFAAYGPTRLPPPGTQTIGQPANTAPYYQGPTNPGAPSLPSNYTIPGQQPPAQFSPPAGTSPASSYQQGQWRGVSQSSSAGGGVVPASYTEEISTRGQAASGPTQPAGGSLSNSTSQSSMVAADSGTPVRGMRINEVADPVPALSPPPTATAPSSGWTSMAPQTASSPQIGLPPQPSRIP